MANQPSIRRGAYKAARTSQGLGSYITIKCEVLPVLTGPSFCRAKLGTLLLRCLFLWQILLYLLLCFFWQLLFHLFWQIFKLLHWTLYLRPLYLFLFLFFLRRFCLFFYLLFFLLCLFFFLWLAFFLLAAARCHDEQQGESGSE